MSKAKRTEIVSENIAAPAPSPTVPAAPVWEQLLPVRYRPYIQLAVIVLLSIQMALYLWSPNLKAQWGLIDDHEILTFLGPDKQVGFFEIPGMWQQTEVRSFGEHVRFRPSYYFFRLLECFLWGPNPGQWYAARIGMFALSLGIAMWLAVRVAGFWIGVPFALWLATGEYWELIWGRLGPAETYAAAGTALYCLGFTLVLDFLKREVPEWYLTAAWAIAAVGGFMSIGSKENFVFLALPTAFLLWHQYRNNRFTFASAVSGGLIIALSLIVALAVGLALSSSGRDIYQQSVSVGSRSTPVFKFLGENSIVRNMALLALILAGLSHLSIPAFGERLPAWRRLFLKIATGNVLILLLFIAQIYYYNVMWEPNTRYAFPGEILRWLALFLPIAWLLNESEAYSLGPVARTRLTAFACIFLLGATWLRGYDKLIKGSGENARKTIALAKGVDSLERIIAKKPNALVVLWSTNLGDYESYYTLRTLLRAEGVKNPIGIWTPDFSQYSTHGFAPELAETLKKGVRTMQEGGDGFASLALMKDPKGCISIGITRMPPSSECDNAGIMLE